MAINSDYIGRLNHSKGPVEAVDGVVSKYAYTSWDFVRQCTGEDCPLVKHCFFWNDGNNKKLASCKVERTYIRNQNDVFIPLMEMSPDPFIIQAIGDHIIPLYHDLCKVQMEIAAWECSLMYTDKSGKRNIIPLYKEKREIQTTIWKVMRESGVIAFAKELGFFMPKVSVGGLPGVSNKKLKPGFGDGQYVDKMYASTKEPIVED